MTALIIHVRSLFVVCHKMLQCTFPKRLMAAKVLTFFHYLILDLRFSLWTWSALFKNSAMNSTDWTFVCFACVFSWSTDQGGDAGVWRNLREAVRCRSLQQRPLWDRRRRWAAVTAPAPKGEFLSCWGLKENVKPEKCLRKSKLSKKRPTILLANRANSCVFMNKQGHNEMSSL